MNEERTGKGLRQGEHIVVICDRGVLSLVYRWWVKGISRYWQLDVGSKLTIFVSYDVFWWPCVIYNIKMMVCTDDEKRYWQLDFGSKLTTFVSCYVFWWPCVIHIYIIFRWWLKESALSTITNSIHITTSVYKFKIRKQRSLQQCCSPCYM